MRDPDLAQAVARLRKIAQGTPWRPVRDRCRLQEGRAWIKQAATDLADAIDGDSDPHEVIAAFDRFAASLWDATHKRRRSLNDPGEPGAHTFAGRLRAVGRDAYLRWRAALPHGGHPTGHRFHSVEQVRQHLAAGGDSPAVLSYSRASDRARALADELDEAALAGGGSFIATRRSDNGRWNLHLSASGQALVPRVDFASCTDAIDVGDLLKTRAQEFWDHPDHWLTGLYPLDEVLDVLTERRRRAGGGMPLPGQEPPPPDDESIDVEVSCVRQCE
ncbi:hypothetical protein [Nonomuraea sp. NPDC049400]|uniref:hypothetical protein n=1 Tax=Nonomuraea sp. NPDC049400 TaxID=3364352 RepID=UPI0037A0A48E